MHLSPDSLGPFQPAAQSNILLFPGGKQAAALPILQGTAPQGKNRAGCDRSRPGKARASLAQWLASGRTSERKLPREIVAIFDGAARRPSGAMTEQNNDAASGRRGGLEILLAKLAHHLSDHDMVVIIAQVGRLAASRRHPN